MDKQGPTVYPFICLAQKLYSISCDKALWKRAVKECMDYIIESLRCTEEMNMTL